MADMHSMLVSILGGGVISHYHRGGQLFWSWGLVKVHHEISIDGTPYVITQALNKEEYWIGVLNKNKMNMIEEERVFYSEIELLGYITALLDE